MHRPEPNQFFMLFSCVQIVTGYKAALLCDIQRSVYQPIDKELASFLKISSRYTVEQIVQQLGSEKEAQILAFFDHMVASDLGFYTDSPASFPPISLEWKSALPVTHAILQIGNMPDLPYRDVIASLDQLGCTALQIQVDPVGSLDILEIVLECSWQSRIKSIELIIPGGLVPEPARYAKNLLSKYLRITLLVIHGMPEYSDFSYRGALVKFVEPLDPVKNCGCVSSAFFNLNIYAYTEAQRHNSCLNRKISIDTQGAIKNCPSMQLSFGNIKDVSLQDAVEHPSFKKYWHITKDQIAVCRDCEYRYICTDCRAYLENPDDTYSKPLKCGYNPYTCEWEDWSKHPLKQQAIDRYGLRDVLAEFQLQPDAVPAPRTKAPAEPATTVMETL